MAGITTSAEGTADRESRPAEPLSLPPLKVQLGESETGSAPSEPLSSTAPAGSFRELMTVAVPLVLSSGSLSLMIAIDRLFLTWYSEDALAASLPAAALHWTVMSAFVGMINYGNAFVAQYEGAGRKDRVAASVWQGIFLAIGAGLLFLTLFPLAPWFFAQGGHAPEVQHYETQFFRTLSCGAIPMLVTMAFGCFYSGRGKTRIVMYVDFLLAATNIALDPCLIFGVGPFPRLRAAAEWLGVPSLGVVADWQFLPRLGIVGAGLSTVIAYTVAVIAYVILSFRHRDSIEYNFWKHIGLDRELLGRLLRFGLPTGLQMAAEISAFTVFLVLVGRLGTAEMAATNLAFNVNMLSFVPMVGLATAVMTLVGKRVGEGRPQLAERTVWLAAGATAAYMLFFAMMFVVFPKVMLRPFTGGNATAELAGIQHTVVVLLRFTAVYTFFDGMALVFAFAIRGAGDTRFPFYYTLVSAWLVMVLPTWVMIKTGHGGLLGCWLACSAYICLLGTACFLRFLQGKWKTMSIIGAPPSVH
ncbi:MAG TPA: MATE family efflux transporter [Planctomycetaceae bacterium]|nr:MATE family efflux transporter [Planctomycetaceae bacterium]